MMKNVLVCGAGVVGLATALALVRRGHRVTVIERDLALRDGCSFGNAGMIVPSHFLPLAAPGVVAIALRSLGNSRSPFYLRPRVNWEQLTWCWRFLRSANATHVRQTAPVLAQLHLESRRILLDEYARDLGIDCGLRTSGLLVLCRSEQALEHEVQVVRQANELGVLAEVVSPRRAAELDADVTMSIAGGVYFPLDCHLDPGALMCGLEAAVARERVESLYSAELIGWRVERMRIVAAVTSQGEIPADEFVLAAGAWSGKLMRGLGLRLPLQPGKGYSVTIKNPRQLPRLCSILAEARVAVTPIGGALRVGGTMELSGFDQVIRKERVHGIVAAIPKYFPGFHESDFAESPVWSGYRPVTPDGLPYIGKFNKYSNLWAATGHAMMGVSLAAVSGKLVAEMISGEQPSIPIGACSPDRFRV